MTYTSPLLDARRRLPRAGGLDRRRGRRGTTAIRTASSACSPRASGWVDLSHRGVVTVSGPDRLSWLHSLTTQHVEALAPGGSALDLVLSPHGHVEHELHLVDDGETTWIGVEPGAAEALVTYLDRMRFLLRVEVADVSCRVRRGRRAGGRGARVVPDLPRAGGLRPARAGRRRVAPLRAAASRRAGRPRGGRAAQRARGVRRGQGRAPARGPGRRCASLPASRASATRPTIARSRRRSAGCRPAVHLRQGLLPRAGDGRAGAQPRATAAPARAAAPRRQRRRAPPRPATPCCSSGREVGRVTSVALHHELGPVALAVVKRSVPVDAELVVGPGRRPAGRGRAGDRRRPVTRGDVVRRRRADTMARERTSYDREERSCRTRP